MRVVNSLLFLLGATLSVAVQSPHEKAAKYVKRTAPPVYTKDAPRVRSTSQYLTNATSSKLAFSLVFDLSSLVLVTWAYTNPEFAVDGSALPEIDFNIGESYAGTLPISSDPNDINRLWFWFFPSTNPLASKEITIWLNGGPGCSSLDGLFQENGPFLWQSGTYVCQKYKFQVLNN